MIIKAILITSQQAEELKGQNFAPDSKFNPIQDANGNWFISLEEKEQCNIPWLKGIEPTDLELIYDEI